MGPDHVSARVAIGGLQERGTADLFISFRSEPGDNQIALFIEEEKPGAILDDEGVCPAHRLTGGCCPKRLPHTFAGRRVQTTQLAVAAHTVNVSILKKG